METRVYKGHDLAGRINARTRARVAGLGRAPRCAVLLAPGDAPMAAYARRLGEAAALLGIALVVETYEGGADAVLAQVARLGADPALDAVLALHPLPQGVAPLALAGALGSGKDADGQHPLNAGMLAFGAADHAPATARACALVIEELMPSLAGAEVVIVGASRIVGRPLAALLLDREATVTLCHAATRDLGAHTRRADLVVTAAGVPGLIGGQDIREGAVLLDVAVVAVAGGLVGDVELASVMGRAAVVTHVPDGIGPVTTACLFENVVRAAGGH